MLEERVGEASAEEGSVNVYFAGFGNVDFLTPRAVSLESRCTQSVAQANWQHLLPIAKGARACPVHSAEELLIHFSKASGSTDKAHV